MKTGNRFTAGELVGERRMDEFEQLFQQAAAAPQGPLEVTTDVTGQDAAALEAFCQCLAMLASGSRLAPAEALRPGLAAIQSVMWQIQSGLGLAASGVDGWPASRTCPRSGQKTASASAAVATSSTCNWTPPAVLRRHLAGRRRNA